MMRVKRYPEPAGFDEEVRQPGSAISFDEIDKHPLWRGCLPELERLYARTCVYTGMRIPAEADHSVDHFKPKSEFPKQAYEWRNFRYTSLKLNRAKGVIKILDPFLVKTDWFELEFYDFQVVESDSLQQYINKNLTRAYVKNETLALLNLAWLRKAREQYVKDYESGMSFKRLKEKAPFVAKELQRQRKLRAGDLGRKKGLLTRP